MNPMRENNDDPFGNSHRLKPLNSRSAVRPKPLRRVIGAVFGGFALCFLSILLSLPFLAKVDLVTANVSWGLAFLLGTIGGFLIPGVGQFLAYALLIFMNVMLSYAIGRNMREQILLFLIFAVVELLCLAARHVSRSSH